MVSQTTTKKHIFTNISSCFMIILKTTCFKIDSLLYSHKIFLQETNMVASNQYGKVYYKIYKLFTITILFTAQYLQIIYFDKIYSSKSLFS